MAEVLTLADLPPEVAADVMKRIRIRLRPPLPPELSWEADTEQPHSGPPTESAEVEFTSSSKGERVEFVDRPSRPPLTCEVPDELILSSEMSAPCDLPADGPTERVTARDGGEYKLECWFGEESLGQ